MKRKIVYITGTRAEFGLVSDLLQKIQSHPDLELEIIATGIHSLKEFGDTITEVKKTGIPYHISRSTYEEDTRQSMARFTGRCIDELSTIITGINPDFLLVLGDRAEMLAGAVCGVYLGIPVAHIHGGEQSSTVDDIVRHAITKLSHVHFAATKKSAQRIIRMGEDPSRVYITGAPGLDRILKGPLPDPTWLSEKYGIDRTRPLFLVVQHPVSLEIQDSAIQMYQTLEAIRRTRERAIIIYPNADAGGRAMVAEIEKHRNEPNITIFTNIPHDEYLGLLKISSAIIGNSSSGIIEAGAFRIPAVNIGTRQQGRERAENVIDTGYDADSIHAAIQKVLNDTKFKNRVAKCRSPYGNGTAGEKIVNVLANISVDPRLMQKRMTY